MATPRYRAPAGCRGRGVGCHDWLRLGGRIEPFRAPSLSHVMRPVLGQLETEVVVCGMALGYADPDAPENVLATKRDLARKFARFERCGGDG